jgi:hypothetical protein
VAVLHFSHHLCRVANPQGLDRADSREYYANFGHHVTPPRFYSCHHARGSAARFTADVSKVTCRWCLKDLERESEERWQAQRERNPIGTWKAWTSPRELTGRAWVLCCRHAGVKRPRWIKAERIEELDRERALRDFKLATGVALDLVTAEQWRSAIEKMATQVTPTQRESLRLAFDKCTMIGDLLEEANRMLDEARLCVEEVAATVAGSDSINWLAGSELKKQAA